MEKIAENRMYTMIAPYWDRLDYIAAVSNGLVWVETVEQMMGLDVPAARPLPAHDPDGTQPHRIAPALAGHARARHRRRHGPAVGTARTRRDSQDLRTAVWRAIDLPRLARRRHAERRLRRLHKDVKQFVNNFPTRIDEYETVLSENRIWLSRTVGIGIISAEDAIAIGLSGPALRGSGVAWDVRKSRPYAAYADMDFDIPLGENGDTYDRYLVRLEEMRQSRRIIDQALEGLPDGPVNAKLPKIVKPPVGDYYHSIEGPKGEIGCYLVSDGTAQPWRVRVGRRHSSIFRRCGRCVSDISSPT
jgi:NADH-quinone oxidoreductase subunit D